MRIGEFFLGIGAMAARAALTREIEVRVLYLRLSYVISEILFFLSSKFFFFTAVCEDSGVFFVEL